MATIYNPRMDNPHDREEEKRPDEPLVRPWVKTNDGRTMTFKEWFDAGSPA